MTIIAGAIRWDYFYKGTVASASTSTASREASSLAYAQWRGRAPIHFVSTGTNTGDWGDSQATFDAEIDAAVTAGLKYWAFFRQSVGAVVHDPNGCFGFNYYQASTKNNLINWCSILEQAQLGTTGNYATQVAALVTEFQQSNYQKVLTNRPLVYLFWSPATLAANWGGSLPNFAAFITSLRAATVSAGLGTPYVTVITGLDVSVLNGIGADAISQYSAPWPYTLTTPWATYETSVQANWASMAALGKPIIPIAMTGFDQRPRVNSPVFATTTCRPYFGGSQYVVAPTNAELTSHLQAAVAYINAHPTECPSSALLIYAWNEHSENGNVLNPTLNDPTGTRCTAAGVALIGA